VEVSATLPLREPLKLTDNGEGTYKVVLCPVQLGLIRITAKLDGQEIADMPATVRVSSCIQSFKALNEFAPGFSPFCSAQVFVQCKFCINE
jgi:hypothetical protein